MADNWIMRMMREHAKKSENTPRGQRIIASRVGTSPVEVGNALSGKPRPKPKTK